MVVLTVIEDEIDAVRRALGANHEIGATSVFAPVKVAKGKPSLPFVLGRCASRSNIPAQSSASHLIEDWRPEVMILVGIAGGVVRAHVREGKIEWRGPQPGDVVIAEYVHYAAFTKNVPSGTQLRYFPIDQPTSALVQAHGDALRFPGEGVELWHSGIAAVQPDLKPPKVHIGEIVAVEGLAGDPWSDHQKDYLRRFDHAVAVDMESAGVGRALHEARTDIHYNPRWMCIRAVSDPVYAAATDEETAALPREDNSAIRDEWRSYAVATAGRFTRRILERLLCEDREEAPADPLAEAFGPWS